jgi:hypothetical protein
MDENPYQPPLIEADASRKRISTFATLLLIGSAIAFALLMAKAVSAPFGEKERYGAAAAVIAWITLFCVCWNLRLWEPLVCLLIGPIGFSVILAYGTVESFLYFCIDGGFLGLLLCLMTLAFRRLFVMKVPNPPLD